MLFVAIALLCYCIYMDWYGKLVIWNRMRIRIDRRLQKAFNHHSIACTAPTVMPAPTTRLATSVNIPPLALLAPPHSPPRREQDATRLKSSPSNRIAPPTCCRCCFPSFSAADGNVVMNLAMDATLEKRKWQRRGDRHVVVFVPCRHRWRGGRPLAS